MKLKELILKNFGKFRNRSIELSEGINVIYGENEAGKSTIHTFLRGMLFGLERGRGRAALKDTFSKYEPWENPNDYSGCIRFVCGDRTFCLNRSFDKYSKSASLFCEEDGEELSLEHGDLEILLGGLKEQNYENTIGVAQTKALVGAELGEELKNFAANYYMTGDSDIDLRRALSYLKEKKKELEKEVRQQEEERQRKKESVEQEASYVWRDIYRLEQEIEQEQEEKAINEERLKKVKVQKNGMERWRIHPIAVIVMLLVLGFTMIVFEKPWNFYIGIVVGLGEFIYIWNALKSRKKKAQAEAEIQEEGKDLRQLIDKSFWHLENLNRELKEKNIQYSNLKEQIEELEEMSIFTEEQRRKRSSLEMAEETMLEIANEMQTGVSQRLNEELSHIFSEMTNGKYEKVWVEEGMKISLYTENKKISMNQVSQGTLEQLYLALRLAAVRILYEEEYPVVLDDAFVYYDDVRLRQTLKWLSGYANQILIFTCQKREEEILKELGISYHKIEL